MKKKKGKLKLTNKAAIKEVLLDTYTEECIKAYGGSVIEDRALPDFQDGLKPVYRRSLYAAYKSGLRSGTAHKKSARVVGDTIGKYHPHGDSACYGAIVTMVNSACPPMEGSGNWGGPTDPPAAYRYTNLRLSKYGDACFFDPDYIQVAELIPNFDGTEQEPLLLPALLPNLLLNGAEGIAVGTTTNIPPFKMAGVIGLVERLLKGEEITAKDCYKNLQLNYKYGGQPYMEDKEDKLEYLKFFKTGQGSVYLIPEYTFDQKSRTLVIKSIPRGVNIENALGKAADDERVKSVRTTGLTEFRVQLKPSVPVKELEEESEDIIQSYFVGRQSYRMNLTRRYYDDKSEVSRAEFFSWSPVKYLQEWVKWRIELEVKSLTRRIENADQEIHRLELMALAASKLAVIFKALKRDDTEKYIAKELKITVEDAEYIVSRQIRTLKKLEQEELKQRIKDAKAHRDELKSHKKKPQAKIAVDIKAMAKKLAN